MRYALTLMAELFMFTMLCLTAVLFLVAISH